MGSVDLHDKAWAGIRNGFEADRLAHAYVIAGSPRGNGLHFAEAFLKLLFCAAREKPCNDCTACRQVDAHLHVDTLWIEPQSKSRMIVVDDIDGLIHRISQTSFEGGWKAGVILQADRMNPESENKLLKTLEEPPVRTILLLVTESPQSLLPTILSRCQKIVLSEKESGAMGEVWSEPLMNILHDLPPANGLGASHLAIRLKGLFDAVKAGIADAVEEDLNQTEEALDESKLKGILEARTNARLKEVQADVFREILDWHRDMMMLASGIDSGGLVFSDELTVLSAQATRHSQSSALQAIQVIEVMARRLDRNIPDLQIFDEAFRQLVRR